MGRLVFAPPIQSSVAVITTSFRHMFYGVSVTDHTAIIARRPLPWGEALSFAHFADAVSLLFAVVCRMTRVGIQLNIFRPIIKSIPVYMMNMFFLSEGAPKQPCHDETVFILPFTPIRNFDHPIKKIFATLSSVMFFLCPNRLFPQIYLSKRGYHFGLTVFSPGVSRRVPVTCCDLGLDSLPLFLYLFGGPFMAWFERCFIFLAFHTKFICHLGVNVNAV